jgi:hypothetical protein
MKLRLILIYFICLNVQLSFSQYLVVNFNNDSQLEYGIQEVAKVRFENDFMLLYLTDETIVSWGLNLIHNYYHSESGLGMTINSPLRLDPKVNLFPNPSAGSFTLAYTLHSSAEIKVMIFNAEGKNCYENVHKHNVAGEMSLAIQLEQPVNGNYSIVIETDQQRITKPMIIQDHK